MYSSNDTICAISTPPGKGAIAIIRCSGPDAHVLCDKIIAFPSAKKLIDLPANTLHFCSVHEADQIIDQVVVSIFKKPHSYSGEDIIEISCHGSVYIQKKILELLVHSGARMATAGEFTLRAFLNGKLDLTQVEAIGDLIASGSQASHRIAINQMRGGFTNEIKKLRDKLLTYISLMELELDFSEEDVEFANRTQLSQLLNEITTVLDRLSNSFVLGNVLKSGIPVAIVGKTNAGKSTLLNLLASEEKAIVSDIAGTTRDSIEDVINIRGIHFRLIDTAGLRHTEDAVEKLGIERTWQKIDKASVIIQVLDVHSQAEEITRLREKIARLEPEEKKQIIVVLNKMDLVAPDQLKAITDRFAALLGPGEQLIPISAKKGIHLEKLEQALVDCSNLSAVDENDVIITNVRHFEAIDKALAALKRTEEGMASGFPGDLLSQDIREALHYLGEITGEITNDEILGNIFKNFCIGK